MDAFDKSTKELLNDPDYHPYLTGAYLDQLRENLRDLGSAFGRSLTLLLLVFTGFEFLTRAAVDKANVGPFEVSDLFAASESPTSSSQLLVL